MSALEVTGRNWGDVTSDRLSGPAHGGVLGMPPQTLPSTGGPECALQDSLLVLPPLSILNLETQYI